MGLRTNTLVDDYEYVSQLDDAVDRSVENFDHKWKLYRDGTAAPPLKADAVPTHLKLRHITSTERLAVYEIGQDSGGHYLAAARFALVGARGLDLGGEPFQVKFETLVHGGVKFRVASRATLDALPEVLLIEIGSVALERSQVRPSS